MSLFEQQPVTLYIPERPLAWGRPMKLKKSGLVVTPTNRFRTATRKMAKATMAGRDPLIGTLKVEACFTFERPNGRIIKPFDSYPHRPDLDNLIKCILDAMNGVVFHDDQQVGWINATKVYAAGYAAHITVTPWPSSD